jgi:hypothetical protein
MDIQVSGMILLNLTSCILGIVVAAILWRYPREKNYNNRLLSLSFVFLSSAQAIGLLVETAPFLMFRIYTGWEISSAYCSCHFPGCTCGDY